jgi:hypothetical protein
MQLTTTTSVTDRATPLILEVVDAISPARVRPIVGRAVTTVVRRHFFGLDRSRPNVMGGTRTHFYADAARGTSWTVETDGVLISVAQVGIRQRIVGGTIRPKNGKKFLTIPARAEAYGKRASEFNDLVLVRRGDHRFGEPFALARAFRTTLKITGAATALALGERQVSRGEQEGGEIMFWLKKSVTQQGDPSVAPSIFEMFAGIRIAMNDYLDRQAARALKQSGGAN